MPTTLFIGAKPTYVLQLARQLRGQDEEVIAIVRKPEDAEGVPEGTKVLQVDVLDKASVETAGKQVD